MENGSLIRKERRKLDALGLAASRINALPSILKVICESTGMGFAAVARVTGDSWTVCAVRDDIGLGLSVGGQLPVETTLCHEVRQSRELVVIDQVSIDATYCDHHTPRLYGLESYISVPILLKDGEYFGNLCAVDRHPAKVSDPKVVGMFVAFAQLISEYIASGVRTDDAEHALSTEREVSGLREQFIAVLSHDLRTPLSAIGVISAILKKNPESEVNRLGERLRIMSRRMEVMINEVLDFARGRMGSGVGIVRKSNHHLATALQEVVYELQLSHPERKIGADIQLPAAVYCDGSRMQQVLSNLLSNALAHSSGEDLVHVQAKTQGSSLVMKVRNQGTPIDPEHLSQIFQAYWRPPIEEKPLAVPSNGLGLGLHICTEIVKAHEGTITVTSRADEGTVFTVTLPRACNRAESS